MSRQAEVIAGLSAGFATTIVGHPLDLIKVRLQLNHTQLSQVSSIIQVVQQINNDGKQAYKLAKSGTQASHILRQYYRGITPNLIGNISAWGLYFTLYSEFKLLVRTPSDTTTYFTASAMAGISTSILTNPIWVLKTRILGTTRSHQNAYSSVFDGIRKMLRIEGISSFWRGTVPSVFLVFQGSLQFTFYDHIKDFIRKDNYESATEYKLSTFEYMYALMVSKIFSMVVMYPSQVVRARLQVSQKKVSISSVVGELWKEGRWAGFYKGIIANVVRVLPATAVTFVVYESVRDYVANDSPA